MKMFGDSPAVLLSQADELGLSDEQKKQLQEIEQSASQKARKVLTVDQQGKLKGLPDGPLSMMDLCSMRMKKMMGQKQKKGMMCPMCMKMMQERMHSKGHDE